MESLNDIGVAEDTDKACLTHRGSHHYTDIYELLFRKYKDAGPGHPSILEIGVLDGGSIRMWRRYFPDSEVLAIDINDRVQFPDDHHVRFIQGDAYSATVLNALEGSRFDIIIDDGDHQLVSQKIFVQRYSPMLSDGGILIVEDVVLKEDALELKKSVPEGFCSAIIQMTEGNSIFDSRMMIVYRK